MDPCKNGKNPSIRPYPLKCIVTQLEFGHGLGHKAHALAFTFRGILVLD